MSQNNDNKHQAFQHCDAESITLDDVITLVPLNIKKQPGRSGEMVVQCPLQPKCDFEIQVSTGEFRCFRECSGCPVNGKGKSVNLYRLFYNCSFSEAVRAISEHKAGPVQQSDKIIRLPHIEKADEVPLASVNDRNRTYRTFLKMLRLNDEHRDDLRKRGLSDAQIRESGFKSLPVCGVKSIPEELMARHCVLEGVPFFGKNSAGEWIVCTPKKSGYFIPYFDVQGRVAQLQIRFDVDMHGKTPEEIAQQKSMRYRWATSSYCKNGASAQNIPFWGKSNNHTRKAVIVTEGGLKATVASYISDEWVMAIPGVTCYDAFSQILDFCKKNQLSIIDGFDMDGKIMEDEVQIEPNQLPEYLLTKDIQEELEKPNRIAVCNSHGKGSVRIINGSVYNALAKLRQMAEEKEVRVIPWTWDPAFKGIDDWLLERRRTGSKFSWNDEFPELAESRFEDIPEDVVEDLFTSPGPTFGPVMDENGYMTGTFLPIV